MLNHIHMFFILLTLKYGMTFDQLILNALSNFLHFLIYYSNLVSCGLVKVIIVLLSVTVMLIHLCKCLLGEQIYGLSICLCDQIGWSGSYVYVPESSHAFQYSVAGHQTFHWGQPASSQEPARKQSARGWLITHSISPTVFILLFLCMLLCQPWSHLSLSKLDSSQTHPVLCPIIRGKQLVQNNLSFLQFVHTGLLTRYNKLPWATQAHGQANKPPIVQLSSP